jgi:hypothetical protein
LLPVRHLLRPTTLAPAIATIVAATCFGALFGILPQFLQQVRGLGPQSMGLLLWPAGAAALAGAGLGGAVATRPRWMMVVVIGGLLLLAAAAGPLTGLTRFTGDTSVMLMAATLGLGAAVSMVPALVRAIVSVPALLSRRTVALIFVLRYALQYGIGQALVHFIQTQSTVHSAHLAWQQGFNQLFGEPPAGNLFGEPPAGNLLFGTALVQPLPAAASARALLEQALVLGIQDAARLVQLMIVLGAALSVFLLLVAWFHTNRVARSS